MKNSNNKTNYSSTHNVTCPATPKPLLEVYQDMANAVATAMFILINTTSSKEVRNILSKIYQYQVDNRVSSRIAGMIEDIKGSIHAMHMNDYTRSQLYEDMELLRGALCDEIEDENNHQKDIEDARTIFMFMADHAEEFVDWVEQMEQNDQESQAH